MSANPATFAAADGAGVASGMLTLGGADGGAAGADGVGRTALSLTTASTSLRVILPPGPVPGISVTGIPASLASRLASGLANTRSPRSSTSGRRGASAGAVAYRIASPLVGSPPAGSVLSGTTRRSSTLDGTVAATPSSASSASRSVTVSVGSPSNAMGDPTSTAAPAVTSILMMMPSASASMSTAALSVSIVAMVSSAANGVFS